MTLEANKFVSRVLKMTLGAFPDYFGVLNIQSEQRYHKSEKRKAFEPQRL